MVPADALYLVLQSLVPEHNDKEIDRGMHFHRDTDQIKSTASLTKIIPEIQWFFHKDLLRSHGGQHPALLKQTGPSGVGVKSAGSVRFVAICV